MADQPPDAAEAESRRQSREFIHDVFIDDYAQKAALARAATAKGLGMEPSPYSRPYPGSTVSKQVIHVSNKWMPVIASVATAGALLGGIALLNPRPAHSQAPVQKAPGDSEGSGKNEAGPDRVPDRVGDQDGAVGQDALAPLDLRIKWWYEGGQVHTDVSPLKPGEAKEPKELDKEIAPDVKPPVIEQPKETEPPHREA